MTKEPTSLLHKLMTIFGTVLCIILIPILIINCTMIAKSYLNKDAVPSFGSFFPLIVLTDSMYPEIASGDLIICRQIDAGEVQAGDVISFFDPSGKGTTTVTHRVMEITTDKTGALAWVTKGDANNVEDRAVVPAEKLLGIYSVRVPGAGNIAMFMQTIPGLVICVILPMLLMIAYDIIRRRLYEKGKQDDTQALLAELEALRAEKQQNQQ